MERREDGKVMLRGEFGRVDTVTSNNRIYPRAVIEREIAKLKREARAKKLYGELDHPCLVTDDFRVLTVDGWKPFRDIKIGDKVWSRKDGKAVVSVVDEIVNEPYDGPAYHVKGRSIDSTFTPGHRFLLIRRPDMEDFTETYRTIEDISANRKSLGHSCIPKCADWEGGSKESVVIPGVPFDKKSQHFRNDVSQDLALGAKLFSAFMGIYLSEGNCTSENGENYGIFINQSTPWARRMIWDEILSRFPSELTWHEEEKGFYLSDARLYQYLKPLGGMYEKYVPSEIKSLDADCLKEFIFWYSIGDGRMVDSIPEGKAGDEWNHPNEGWRGSGESFKSVISEAVRSQTIPYVRVDLFSVSERLIRDLHECLVKSGDCGSISRIDPDLDYEFAGRVIEAKNKKSLYQLHLSKSKNIWLDPRFLKVEETKHLGNIYCLSVTHRNFYIEQGGHSFWTGNSDGRTLYQRVSHILRDLSISDDGTVIGEMEIIPTLKGKDLIAIVEAGGAVGVSSRGTGTTHKREDGVDVVNDDYTMITYDVVADPAHTGAYPEVFFESTDVRNLGRVEMPKKDEKAPLKEDADMEAKKREEEAKRKEDEAKRKEAEDEAKKKMESDLLSIIGALRKEVEEDAAKGTETDPKYTEAKGRLEAVRKALGVAESNEDLAKENDDLKKKLAMEEEKTKKFAAIAKAKAVESYISKAGEASGNVAVFKKLLGTKGISEADSADDVKKKVEDVLSIMTELGAGRQAKTEEVQGVIAEIRKTVAEQTTRFEGDITALKKENEELRQKTEKYRMLAEKSMEAAREGWVEAKKRETVESKAGTHPARYKIMKLTEQANLRTPSEIDAFVEKAILSEGKNSALYDETRRHLAKGTGALLNEDGTEKPPALPERKMGGGGAEPTLFGHKISDMQKLAGIRPGS